MPTIDNFETDEKNNLVLISVNPQIYPLPVVFSASYMMLDQAFVVVDGNPETEIVVSLRPKADQNLEQLAQTFNSQLLNYAVNANESSKTALLRDQLIKQAFAGHTKTD